MIKIEDVTNKKFGKLTAIKLVRKDNKGRQIWLFKCDCGNLKELPLGSVKSTLKKHGVVSCGCYIHSKDFKEKLSQIRRKNVKNKVDKHNTSGVTGVSYDKYFNLYVAYIEFHGKKYRQKCKTFEEAVRARKQMEDDLGVYEDII